MNRKNRKKTFDELTDERASVARGINSTQRSCQRQLKRLEELSDDVAKAELLGKIASIQDTINILIAERESIDQRLRPLVLRKRRKSAASKKR
jgi:hypothetical protein